jgi:signal transduction histidine kinase
LSFIRVAPAKTFSVTYVNQILARIFSLGLLAITGEVFVNGLRQIDHLNVVSFSIAMGAFSLMTLGFLVSAWFLKESRYWLQGLAIVTLVLVLTWPLQLAGGVVLPENYQPWIWWTLGAAMVAAGGSFPYRIALGYLVALPIFWFFLRTSEAGGSASVSQALENSIYVFLLASTLTAMVITLRWEAGKVDTANQLAINSAVEGAEKEALDAERNRLDALVHDSVLTTLLVAANANSAEQVNEAKKSAKKTLQKLESNDFSSQAQERLTLASFFVALESSCRENYPEFEITTKSLSDLPIPWNVAQALTEATFQAADNSLKHAQNAAHRSIRLRGVSSGVKIVISDRGKGFRPSQIPRDRIGIRTSIIERVEAVGGKVFLNSSPGKGTNIVLEWENNG